MRAYPLIIVLVFLLGAQSRRFCVWNGRKQQQEVKLDAGALLERESRSASKLSSKEWQLLQKQSKFSHYKPHYMYSYSYPAPVTPHLYIGQINQLSNSPLFLVKHNDTFPYHFVVPDVFIVNGEVDKRVRRHKSLPTTQKFVCVLQMENMLERQIKTEILLYSLSKYWAMVCSVEHQVKVFVMFVANQQGRVLNFTQLKKEGIQIQMRDERGSNLDSWRNVERIQWVNGDGVNWNKQGKPITFSTLVIQFVFPSNAANHHQVHFYEIPKSSPSESLQQLMDRVSQIDPQIFQSPFPAAYEPTENPPTCVESAFNQLMAGVSYEYGTLMLKDGSKTISNEPKELLSFTPSRKRFPWGFLWDDGFHCEVAARNQPQMSLKVIKSWLDTITESGWIPREQNRGQQREYLCNCPRFMAKDVRDANPPTLLLALEYLLSTGYLNSNNFAPGYWEALKSWYNWFLKTQQTTKNSFIFRWHDSIKNEGSFNSGMDDFPRLPNTEGHVDCQAWMYFFSDVMGKLAKLFGEGGETFLQNKEKIKLAFYQNFIEKGSNLPKDYGKKGKKTQYNDNFGYPSILPLAFGMIDEETEAFNATMEGIKFFLDSGHGLTSISMKSKHYLANQNAYWKGPVWININYLFMRGLKKFYLPSAESFYKKLREELIDTVCGNWESSGYFYENYIKGKGSFSYPFTGWTALITIIVEQNY